MAQQTEDQPTKKVGLPPGQVKLENTETRVLAGVLDHSNDLVSSIEGIHKRRSWGEHEPNVTARMFRDIAEDKSKKRLFVCCDGTWKNASGTSATLTNVARFARSIDRFGLNLDYPAVPITQVIYYSGGVGSQSVLLPALDRWYSGATGSGLEENILSAYCFLSNNYNFAGRKDEIILVGYSRGAFTVRCLADFISQVGLLRRRTLPFLSVLFKRWTEARSSDERTKMRTEIRKVDPDFSVPVKIKVLAEWDPVSAMGHIGLRKKFSFVNDEVPSEVEHAFVAVALNERRSSFTPLLWAKDPPRIELAQCAFSGCHGDIGGGNLDAGLSTVSLLWMVSKVEGACQVAFDRETLLQAVQPPLPKKNWWRLQETPAMNLAWSKGKINESLKGKWWVPHLMTFGWLSGRRRRYLRNTFPPPADEAPNNTDNQQAEPAQDMPPQPEPAQDVPPQPEPAETVQQNDEPAILSGLFKTNHNSLQPFDGGGHPMARMVSRDVAEKIQLVIPNLAEANAEYLASIRDAAVQTAVHAYHDEDEGEVRITAAINAAFKTPSRAPTRSAVEPDSLTSTETTSTTLPPASLRRHFTVDELNYETREGTIESILEKINLLGHRRTPFATYLDKEPANNYERRLWGEWRRQVELWGINSPWGDPGGPSDVRFWTKVLTKFDKGNAKQVRTQSAKVDLAVSLRQLWRACQAMDGCDEARAHTDEAAMSMISAAFNVARVALSVENEKGSEGAGVKALDSIWDAILDMEHSQESEGSVGAQTNQGNDERVATTRAARVVAEVAEAITSPEQGWVRVEKRIRAIISSNEAADGHLDNARGKVANLRGVLANRSKEHARTAGIDGFEDLENITSTDVVAERMKTVVKGVMRWQLREEEDIKAALVWSIDYPN